MEIINDTSIHRYLIAFIFITAGILHFYKPRPFMRIMPGIIPHHRLMVYISGLFEVSGGIGILFPFTQEAASWGLIALLVAVYPANINMTFKAYKAKGLNWYTWLTILRLPLQFVLIYWVYWAGILM